MRGTPGLCLSLVALIACSETPLDTSNGAPPTASAPDAGEAPPKLTFYRDVKPIFDDKCNQCHVPGEIGPVDLTDPTQVERWAPVIKSVVMAKEMPPWHASDECIEYENKRPLAATQIDTIAEWVDLGAPMGDVADGNATSPRVPPGLTREDRALPVEAEYLPHRGDDYRCFAIPWDGTVPQYITGYEVRPSNPAVVHHVNVFSITGPDAQERLNRQAQTPGAGFECFGGQFTEGTTMIGSWVPGNGGNNFPADSGILIEPGSVFVLETHFNTDAIDPAPDRSSLVLRLEDTVAKRAMVAAFWNFFEWDGSGGMMIPSGSADTMHAFKFDPAPFVPQLAPWITSDTIRIHAVGMHMHYLGKRGLLRIDRYDGPKDCLLEVPEWDFSWQSAYFLKEPVEFALGRDKMYLECEWDNTAANQPIIRGEQRTPRDVTWGSGSGDEMCIGLFYLTQGD